MRKVFLKMLCLAVLIAGPMAFSWAQEDQRIDFSGYNIVFVSFDALQAAHTHCLGYSKETTPQIDAFASKGFLFTQAIAQSSWTVPSSMSWFTSMYPSEHRVVNKYSQYDGEKKVFSNLTELSPGVVTLAEILRENGYVTGGFTGDAGVSAKFGFGKGFDVYVDDKKFAGLDHSVPPAIEWLRANKDRKFMVFLHGYDSHGQHDPAEGYTLRFLGAPYKGTLKGGKEEQGLLRERGLNEGRIQLTKEDVRFWRALYDEKIYDANQRFKAFVDELNNLGLMDKTVIVLTADHGTEFYEHQRFDHGFSLYDELIHVPLVIYLPGVKAGKTITDQVRGIDLMPTILDLLKITLTDKEAAQMRGRSLVPLLKGAHVQLDAYTETDYRLYTHKRALRTSDGWKFIYALESDQKELYNLNKDPQEKHNLVNVEQRKAYELEQQLFTWLKSMPLKSGNYSKESMIKEY
ncbi:MAG: sulfatase [Candidatus Omnitrophica bacterium]|nr:sulfatase [Candidatus Omnitrophota bacterium]